MPTSYGATLSYDHRVDDVRISLASGNVTDYDAEPPLPPLPDRIPITDADSHGVMDPMTSMLNRVAGNGDPVSPEACNRKVAVFDGRVRYDLHSEFKRMDSVKADRGYEGPAVVCAVRGRVTGLVDPATKTAELGLSQKVKSCASVRPPMQPPARME